MILRLSSLFVRTLREDPADAEVPSHRLLLRAGYIRRAAPGIYTWLPLGLRVLRRIENIIRDEMDAMGAQELLFPALLPREPYEASGRWTEYGDGIFRLKDRKGNDYLLGPTHEEMFTLVVKDLYSSYKDLPLSIYQIQTKYRDEARPRAGILRGREFTMKDSYSFDVDDAGLDASYQKHRDAYIRIFDKLGFEYVIVKAEAGAMGGSKSEEFLAKAAVGEDTYVRCTLCDYAANVEAVDTPAPAPVPYDDAPAAHAEQTPATPTIETLVDHLNEKYPRDDRPWTAGDTLKNIVFSVRHPDGTTEAARHRPARRPGGRHQAARVQARRGRGVRAVRRGRLRRAAEPGQGLHRTRLRSVRRSPPACASCSTPASSRAPRGSPAPTSTAATCSTWWPAGTSPATASSTSPRSATATPAPTATAAPCTSARGIEMGHIFQLGRQYADALGLQVLDENGKLVTVTMGSYGIGPSRAVAAIAENTLDEMGLCWPRAVAPADVHIVAAGKDEAVFAAAEQLAADLSARGLTVMYDDRKASPGVKFKDAELIGVPTIVTVGRGLADGLFEVKDRASGERTDVAVGDAVDHLAALVRS